MSARHLRGYLSLLSFPLLCSHCNISSQEALRDKLLNSLPCDAERDYSAVIFLSASQRSTGTTKTGIGDNARPIGSGALIAPGITVTARHVLANTPDDSEISVRFSGDDLSHTSRLAAGTSGCAKYCDASRGSVAQAALLKGAYPPLDIALVYHDWVDHISPIKLAPLDAFRMYTALEGDPGFMFSGSGTGFPELGFPAESSAEHPPKVVCNQAEAEVSTVIYRGPMSEPVMRMHVADIHQPFESRPTQQRGDSGGPYERQVTPPELWALASRINLGGMQVARLDVPCIQTCIHDATVESCEALVARGDALDWCQAYLDDAARKSH